MNVQAHGFLELGREALFEVAARLEEDLSQRLQLWLFKEECFGHL